MNGVFGLHECTGKVKVLPVGPTDHSVPEQTHFHFVGFSTETLRSCVSQGSQGLLLEDESPGPQNISLHQELQENMAHWVWLDLPGEL